MIAVPPIDCTVAGRLVLTNAVDWAAFNLDTTYDVDAQCSYAGHHYTSLQTVNTGNTPDKSPLWWFDEGQVNSLMMFDSSVQTATTCTGSLSVTLAVGRFTAIGLMGLIGQSVSVSIDVGLENIFSETRTLQASDGSYYSFVFEDLKQQSAAYFYDLPSALDAQVTITIDGPGETACGLCVIGTQFYLGAAIYGFSFPIEDRGRSYLDKLGNPVTIERGHSKGYSGTVVSDRKNFNRLNAFFSTYIGVPMLWVAAPEIKDLVSSTVFGRYVRAVPVIESSTVIKTGLEISGYR